MRKSKRLYINNDDINNGEIDGFNCPVHNCIKRYGLLKGKTFYVNKSGICIGPNKKTVLKMEDENISIEISQSAKDFIELYDDLKLVGPRHITIIDESGKYLK